MWERLVAVGDCGSPRMPSRTDSERRKARDAALRTQDELIAAHIAEALRSGELRSAPSFGKPITSSRRLG
jgi:hypothetical protein